MTPPSTPSDPLDPLDAFDRFAVATVRTLTMRTSLIFSGVFCIAIVVGRLSPNPKKDFETGLLAIQALFCFFSWVLLRFVPVAGRHPITTTSLMYWVVAGAGGYLLGALGGLDSPTFYGIYFLPILVVAVPYALYGRILITLTLLVPYLLAYFVPHPEHLDHPLVHIPVLYLLTSTVVSVLMGHWIFGLSRDRFVLTMQLEHQGKLLADTNAKLNLLVKSKSSQVEHLSARIETVRIDARTDLARALHDDLGQLIVGARMELGNIERLLSSESGEDLSFLYEIVDALASSTKRIVGELRDDGPERSSDLGASLESLLQPIRSRARMRIDTHVELEGKLPAPTREVIYRTVQEAMTNILKHAEADSARISIAATETDEVVVVVQDDGVGFDVGEGAAGWGLVGLRERAEALGGRVTVESSGRGTMVEVRLPMGTENGVGSEEVISDAHVSPTPEE